ncbi:DNA-binding storekeeper protein-relatedtranscriptional regulator [Striga asiatica]|uniref:DNA-binding storekeeper protein-relatedtranscriptional regulator n=1 Tax=Striga asiatica TaxID=4170 RepID=A0A5A7QV81_STRAF|nr:DNA-binding storekeeper protein-relatedtranscriptional regulator [Striga asiatica]
MAKAREPVSSGTSSGEEETDDSSSEEIGSEPEQIRKTSPPPAAARKPQTPSAIIPAPSDEDSESESPRKKSKAKGKDKAAAASASAARSTRKRAVEEVKGTEPAVTKKSKKSKKAETREETTVPEDMERGRRNHHPHRNSDLNDNLDAFFEFIKKNLQIEATRAQLRDKIFRMKKKYRNNKRKEHDGKGRTFTSQHEREAYDLSEKVWGEAYDLSEKVWGAEKENVVEKANGSMAEKENGVEKTNGSGADTNTIKDSVASERRFVQMKARLLSGLGENLPAVGDVKEYEWKKLENEEMEVNARYFEVMTQHSKLLLQIKKSRGH